MTQQSVTKRHIEAGALSGSVVFPSSAQRMDDPQLEIDGQIHRVMSLSWLEDGDDITVRYRWFIEGVAVVAECRLKIANRHPHRPAFEIADDEWSLAGVSEYSLPKPQHHAVIKYEPVGIEADISIINSLRARALKLVEKL